MVDSDEEARKQAVPKPVTMSTEIANFLVVRGPLSREQIEVALNHYEKVEALLRISGPRFVNARRDTAEFYNKALERLRELEQTPIAREDSRQPLEV